MRRGTLAAATLAGPGLALLVTWLPVLRHYHVPDPAIDGANVSRLRKVPAEAVLERLEDVRYEPAAVQAPDTLARADELLAGRVRLRSGATPELGLAPGPALLQAGTPGDQLEIASLAPVDTLLAAYRLTGQGRYLDAAVATVLAWSRFEQQAWLPVGFLWNDHAIAARVPVLARLWHACRARPQCDDGAAAQVLGFASRSVSLLARPSHYTIRTNHGIMQDLALLHAAIAFPGLPAVEEGRAVALARLAAHVPAYVAPNGTVLEHSTGYQDYAVHLMRTALRYTEALGLVPPADLPARLAAAECRQRSLARPDGSLPVYGDTWNGQRPARVVAENAAVRCAASGGSWIDGDFGYGVLAGPDAASQVFMAWANFVSRAHKHDDELAVWLWHGGRDWLGASGYWPYGDPDRAAATSWRGANAPHAAAEAGQPGGASRLLGAVPDAALRFLDVERRSPGGAAFRRQVAVIDGAGMLVLDSATGGDGRYESVWTLEAGIAARPIAPAGGFLLSVAGDDARMAAHFPCRPACEVTRLSGSRQPFAGLVARDGVIVPTEAFAMAAPFGSWSAVFLDYEAGVAAPAVDWAEPERWALSIPGRAGAWQLRRNGAALALESPAGDRQELAIAPGASQRLLLDDATAAYRDAQQRFPPFRDHLEYRYRASAGVGVLALLQYAGLWVLAVAGLGGTARLALLAGGWAGLSAWLYYGYFG